MVRLSTNTEVPSWDLHEVFKTVERNIFYKFSCLKTKFCRIKKRICELELELGQSNQVIDGQNCVISKKFQNNQMACIILVAVFAWYGVSLITSIVSYFSNICTLISLSNATIGIDPIVRGKLLKFSLLQDSEFELFAW